MTQPDTSTIIEQLRSLKQYQSYDGAVVRTDDFADGIDLCIKVIQERYSDIVCDIMGEVEHWSRDGWINPDTVEEILVRKLSIETKKESE